ncbi:MAG: metallophosphoesterase [Candidatus Aminicenantales bacterium]
MVSKLKRRDFFKGAGTGVLASLAGASLFSSLNCTSRKSLSGEYPFPYDSEAFEASERIAFLSDQKAFVNVIPRAGQSLDIKLFRSEDKNSISGSPPLSYSGVKDSLNIPVSGVLSGPELFYRLEYRANSKGKWMATPERRVRTPVAFQESGRMDVLLISDDHTFDDGDMVQRIVNDPALIEMRLSGDYVNFFLQELRQNRHYVPDESTDPGKMMSGFCLASAISTILKNETPDLIILMGDTTGIGAGYKWKGLGLKDTDLTSRDYDDISRILWLRERRMLSALTPSIPIYLVLGNHDGEIGFDSARIPAGTYRRKYFKQPGAAEGGSSSENYYPLFWGDRSSEQGVPLFVVLDSDGSIRREWPKRPEEWTLGSDQKEWFKKILPYETNWKFVFFHNVIGGWPRGSDEQMFDYCYGRGPLFTYEDHQGMCPNPHRVEQVELTEVMMKNGVRANFYGHDHIFHVKEISAEFGSGQKRMFGICAGSTKHRGELGWYKGELWKKYYGSFGRFWTEPHAVSEKTDFWGPSGYTKLTISRWGTRVEYKRAANNNGHTNIPLFVGLGDVVASRIL